ncbi:ethylbenzene dehydrogenase-related protein [Pseudoalteromonas sp. S4741]|uniref:ethylbenzene dehydrogenase-related protein n=1 Tax=Pseudoalteromonas sp. S4741 TaxID=579563 RepID=UPI0014861CC2|nr:ethylbenzene dehydrogenase-related protein [Pseudoalteromonas sp. S4741]
MNPNSLQIQPGDTVKAKHIPGDIYLRTLNDPIDLIWDRIPIYSTELYTAPPVHQSARLRFADGAKESKHLYFQVAHTDERLFMRLHWKDATKDILNTVDDFPDGVAVQFAMGDDSTSYMMGSGHDKPVNIWYWKAGAGKLENLAAGGYGSTTLLDNQSVSVKDAYVTDRSPQNREWYVVMSRPLIAQDKYDVDFFRPTIPMGFALWQGNDEERNGNKKVTHTWITLETDLSEHPASKANSKTETAPTEKKKCFWFWQDDDDC